MKKILIFSLLAIFFIACGGDKKQSGAKKTTAKATTPKIDGAKLYKTYCVVCHGTKGDMGANGAVNLMNSTLHVDARKSVVKKGRGVMTPFESILSDEEVQAVADYTMTLSKK